MNAHAHTLPRSLLLMVVVLTCCADGGVVPEQALMRAAAIAADSPDKRAVERREIRRQRQQPAARPAVVNDADRVVVTPAAVPVLGLGDEVRLTFEQLRLPPPVVA